MKYLCITPIYEYDFQMMRVLVEELINDDRLIQILPNPRPRKGLIARLLGIDEPIYYVIFYRDTPFDNSEP